MRNVLEKKIEKELERFMKSIGGECLKFISPGTNGVPDRVCHFPDGFSVYVETKRPKGGRLSEVQKYMHKKLKNVKQNVEVIWTEEDLKNFEYTHKKRMKLNEIHTT
ncbi:VRR-NUC domain-containing protein [Peptoniphilus asaccharolyticus]